jgi:uncharacterized protein (TIGR03435 family)
MQIQERRFRLRDEFAWKGYRSALLLLFFSVLPGACLPVAVVAAQTAPPAGPSLQGAEPAKRWSYDAVSVKQNKSDTDGLLTMMRGDVYSGNNMRIINLVSQAYDIKQDLIFGMPGWTDGAHFDVEAKMSPEDAEAFNKLTLEERKAASKVLLLDILKERFHLKAHVETKQLPIYDLVIAKGGLKMKATTEGDTDPNVVKGPDGKARRGLLHFQDGMLTDQGVEIFPTLVGQLTNLMHRMVIDKTGLKGRFDVTLKYAPDRDAPAGADNGLPQDDAPSIFTALEEQLGLKLQPDKGPVDTVVIDHVEQPTEN